MNSFGAGQKFKSTVICQSLFFSSRSSLTLLIRISFDCFGTVIVTGCLRLYYVSARKSSTSTNVVYTGSAGVPMVL
ncbi:hypothetical protein YC2023_064481 [Brassica napus]